MKKVVLFLSFIVVMANVYAQPGIKGSGDKPKAGDLIYGRVMDSEGPLKGIKIFESNGAGKGIINNYSISDENGYFSFTLADPTDSLFVNHVYKYAAKCPILYTQYNITLEDNTWRPIVQPGVKGYGGMPIAGDVIQGKVMDYKGPLKAIEIFEVNDKHEVVAYAYSDKSGHFSLTLVDPADSLYVGNSDYSPAKFPILNNQYDITLELFQDFLFSSEMHGLFVRSPKYRSIVRESWNYPYLEMDGHRIYRDSKAWEGIKINKGSYSKEELSQLFGIDAGIIKTVEVYKKGEGDEMRFDTDFIEKGIIVLETTRGDNVNE